MKSFSLQKDLPIFIIVILLFWGCKQPETVVIGDSPTASAPSDTTEYSPDGDESDFRKLVIGEYQSISSFDPLRAENNATMRALQLVYEGLVRLDSDGDLTPAVAKNWEVSSDSLTYTFTLNRNTYYHDSDVFSTGTGRRLTARDVKFVFERMARAGNPPAAAKLFWDIEGFEPFYQEQHKVYEPQKRTLSEVSGIKTENDSTVVFELYEKDPQFLKKLATPYALIYPHEAVNNTQNEFVAVGTGPFTLSSQTADSAYIFAKSEKYRNAKNIRLNRVDILTSSSESNLMRKLGTGDIHLLTELGPNLIQNLTTEKGDLKTEFEDRYSLTKRSDANKYVVRSNRDAKITDQDIQNISYLAHADTSSYFGQLPNPIISPGSTNDNQEAEDSTLSKNQFYAVYSDDPFARTYLAKLSEVLERQDAELSMTEFHTPTRNTDLWVTIDRPLITDRDDKIGDNFPELFRFQVYPTAIQHSEITDLNFNQYGWWLNLRGVSLPTLNNLN